MDVGEILRQERAKSGISQEKLALESGLDRTYISLLERGLRQPALSTLLQLANTLEIRHSGMVISIERIMEG